MLQWFKQYLNPSKPAEQPTKLPAEADTSQEPTQPLTDKDYEFLFTQLLEGVGHGWQPTRVDRFFDPLEKRGTKEQWVEWLQRYGAKVLATATPNPDLAKRLITLGELTRSLPELQRIGDTASGIGRLLLAQDKRSDSDTWDLDETGFPNGTTPPPPPRPSKPISVPGTPQTQETVSPLPKGTMIGSGNKTISLDELLVKLQQDANLVQQVAQRLGLTTNDPQVVIEELVRQINQRNVATQTPTPPAGDDAESWFNRGVQLYETGDMTGAIAAWDKAIEIKSDYYQAWGNRGLGLKNLGRYEEAIASYDRALELRPDFHKAWYNRGLALDELERYQEAIESYDHVIAIKPDFHKAWYSRGLGLENLEKWPEAISAFERAIELKPDFYKAQASLGNSLRKVGRDEEAVSSYDQALQLKPDEPEIWANRGLSLKSLGRHQEAVLSFNKSLELKADDADIMLWRGETLLAAGEAEQSLVDYEQILQLKSDWPEAWQGKGIALAQIGRYEESLQACDRAIELKPDLPQAWAGRGDSLAEGGNYGAALNSYERALQLDPQSPTLWQKRGQVLTQLERNEEATACFDLALQYQGDRLESWLGRSEAVKAATSPDLLLTALSPLARNHPELNQRGFEGQLATLLVGLSYFPPDRYPLPWGKLQGALGSLYYQQGKSSDEPETLWKTALDRYQEALKTLTSEPTACLAIVSERVQVLLGLDEITEAREWHQQGITLLQELYQQEGLNQKRLTLELAGLEQLGVDLAVQQGDTKRALELAEANRNRVLSWLCDRAELRQQTLVWADFQRLLNNETALIYWHLSPVSLTTLIIKPNTSEPLVLGQTTNVDLNLALSPNLQSRMDQSRENTEASLAILWDLLGLDDSEPEIEVRSEIPSATIPTTTSNNSEEYAQSRLRLQQFLEWLKVYQNQGESKGKMSTLIDELGQILNVEEIVRALGPSIKNLILVPHGYLHQVPLQSLFDLSTRIIPSLSFGLLESPTQNGNNSVSTEDDLWSSSAIATNLNQEGAPNSLLSIVAIPETHGNSSRGAALEVEIISNYFAKSEYFVAPPLTKTQIGEGLAQGYQCLHFVGDATYNPKYPQQSALVLPKNGLRIEDLRNLPLANYGVVSLALPEKVTTAFLGPDYAGLATLLKSQGVGYILRPLWPVEETVRLLFYGEFYRLLSGGNKPQVAYLGVRNWLRNVTYSQLVRWYLDRAQEMSDHGGKDSRQLEDLAGQIQDDPAKLGSNLRPYSDPRDWGAFVLVGG